ncbi:MAG: NADH-quinone oxidoreductase subunit D [Candidatus Thermoplasmatota archaeon]
MAEMWVNMGPQHPSTHGLWDLLVKVDGETIVDAIPQIGYLHRGIEKIGENRTFVQFIPITDRLCYIANISWSTLYVMSVEELADIKIPDRAKYIRVITLELQRIASHLVWLAAYGADLGLLTMLLYPMRERELILDLFQILTGARLTYNYPRIGGVKNDLPKEFMDRLPIVLDYIEKKVMDYESMMDHSDVFLIRTKRVGILPKDKAIELGVTGPILRASGFKFDLRKNAPYLVYDKFDFNIPVGLQGDSFDRYKVRVEEIKESIKIIRQAIKSMPNGEIIAKVPKAGPKAPKKAVYVRAEDPRGEGAFYLVGNETNKPYRIKIRSPTFVHILALPHFTIGYKIADVPAIMGSVDPCMGEVDR